MIDLIERDGERGAIQVGLEQSQRGEGVRLRSSTLLSKAKIGPSWKLNAPVLIMPIAEADIDEANTIGGRTPLF